MAVGDRMALLHRPPGAPAVALANRILHHERENLAGARLLLEAEGMAEAFRRMMKKRLGQG